MIPMIPQGFRCKGGRVRGKFLRLARENKLPAFVASVGAEVEDPVGGFDDLKVVFDDDEAVAGVDDALENFEQDSYVFEVEAGGGFVEDEQRWFDSFFLAGEFGEVADEFEALAFAAAQSVDGLAAAQVAEADFSEESEGAQGFLGGA